MNDNFFHTLTVYHSNKTYIFCWNKLCILAQFAAKIYVKLVTFDSLDPFYGKWFLKYIGNNDRNLRSWDFFSDSARDLYDN